MRARAILMILGVAAALLLVSQPASPQAMLCNGNANCTSVAGTKTCTHMWSYTVNSYTNTVINTTTPATSCTVMGNNAVRTFVAMQPTTAAPGGCYFAGIFDVGGTFPYTCPIDSNDGLPVELMEFSIEADEE